jgi:hypothetical protein
MDDAAFDWLSRNLSGPTRRSAMRMLLSALAGLAMLPALGESEAKKKRKCIKNSIPFEKPSKPCQKSKQCCGNGKCCDFGLGPRCFNTRKDPTACGATCGTIVNCFNFGQVCVDGTCVDP